MSLRTAFVGRALILMVVGFTVGTTFGQPNDAWLGTWTLSHAKSTLSGISGDLPRRLTRKFEKLPDGSTKVTEDGFGPRGRHLHSETVTRMDGVEVPVHNIEPPLEPSTTRVTMIDRLIDDHTIEAVNKIDGQASTPFRLVLSRDGKTVTQTVTGQNAKGETIQDVVVFDRQ